MPRWTAWRPPSEIPRPRHRSPVTGSDARVTFDLTPREIADAIIARVTVPEDCYEESTIGAELIPALAPLKDYEVDGVGFSFKQRFKKDFSAARSQRWWGSIRAARERQKAEAPPAHREPNGLASIEISDVPLRTLSALSLSALQAHNNPPSLFSRSGEMVHVATDEQGSVSLRTVTEARLRGHLTRTADYLTATKNSLKHVSPPIDVVRDLLAYSPAAWGFPAIRGVTEIPALRPDGTALDREGYDAATGLHYAPAGLTALTTPESPTLADVAAARALIDEAIGEFPYDSAASRANAYALLLTPILRPAIDGNVPLCVIDAPQAGTGKGLLADVLFTIATGRSASMIPYPWREDEMQKQISSCLWAGRPLVCFDNLEGELRSPNLALAITARFFECRILGVSKNMMAENRATWIVTGNNVKPGGDMPRRCYQIRIDARSPKPYESREFRHPNLPRWVRENRAALLRALLTIARFWFARGCPEHTERPWGSFEEWSRIIGGVLRCAQIPGFLGNRRSFDEEEDESPREWELFLIELDREFPSEENGFSRWFQVSEVIDQLANETSRLRLARPSEVISLMERPRNSPTISLGKMFQHRRGRRFGYSGRQYWLERQAVASEHRGAAMWRVVSSER